MENKEIHRPRDESKKASYKILKYTASEVPKEYRNMLLAKYLRMSRQGNEFFKMIDSTVFFKVHAPYFETLLARPNAKVKVAVLSDDHDVVLGWSLFEPNKLHFVWVGGDYRNAGIAKSLVTDPFSIVTHITKTGAAILSKFQNVSFNPYA